MAVDTNLSQSAATLHATRALPTSWSLTRWSPNSKRTAFSRTQQVTCSMYYRGAMHCVENVPGDAPENRILLGKRTPTPSANELTK